MHTSDGVHPQNGVLKKVLWFAKNYGQWASQREGVKSRELFRASAARMQRTAYALCCVSRTLRDGRPVVRLFMGASAERVRANSPSRAKSQHDARFRICRLRCAENGTELHQSVTARTQRTHFLSDPRCAFCVAPANEMCLLLCFAFHRSTIAYYPAAPANPAIVCVGAHNKLYTRVHIGRQAINICTPVSSS